MLSTSMYHVDLASRVIDINTNVQAVEMYFALNKLWHHPMFRDIPFPFDPLTWSRGYVVPGGDWAVNFISEWPKGEG